MRAKISNDYDQSFCQYFVFIIKSSYAYENCPSRILITLIGTYFYVDSFDKEMICGLVQSMYYLSPVSLVKTLCRSNVNAQSIRDE